MIFPPRKKYVVELDGQTFKYEDGRLTLLQDYSDLSEDCYLITDMQEGIAKTMTVEAPARYVELMVRRKLQEAGEFEEPVTVLTHWKKARGKNTTDIFFTAIPTRLSLYYTENLCESRHAVAVFPIQTLLYNTLRLFKSRKPVALVFQHSRFADLLVGTYRRIYYAVRCTAFDDSDEQLLALWESVRSEIQMAENEYRIKIAKMHVLNWIDSGPLPKWDDRVGIELIPFLADDLLFEEEMFSTSLFTVVRKLSFFQSISTVKEKLFFAASIWAPALTVFLLLTAFGLWGAVLHYSNRTQELVRQKGTLEQKYIQLRSKIPVLSSAGDYRPTLNFVKGLAAYESMPNYKKVISDLASAMSMGMMLEVLTLTYSTDELRLELYGPIKAPFDQAHASYQRFLKITEQKGYTIMESKFDTVIDESRILVRLVKKWT
jgi:hypothetical protein